MVCFMQLGAGRIRFYRAFNYTTPHKILQVQDLRVCMGSNIYWLNLQPGMQHRELSMCDALLFGGNPEESFSLMSADNLLTQQRLNLSCLSKEPANLLQISTVVMLA